MQRTMKRVGALILAIAMLVTFMPSLGLAEQAHADEEGIKVFMTVSDKGVIATTKDNEPMAWKEVTVKDLDSDGKYTLDEALKAAHEQYNSADGYAAMSSGWVTSVWGDSTAGVYSFIQNNKPTDLVTITEVKAGDYLVAAVDQDAKYYSDYATFLDADTKTVKAGEEVEFTLKGFGAMTTDDAAPIKGVKVGEFKDGAVAGDAVTDENGKVKLSFNAPGTYIVSAAGVIKDAVSSVYCTPMGKTDDGKYICGNYSADYTSMDYYYTEEDYGIGPYPPEEIKTIDMYDYMGLEEEELEDYHLVYASSYVSQYEAYYPIYVDAPIIVPCCIVTVELPDEAKATVKTAVRNFEKENKFDILPQEVEVSSNAAENFGEFRDIAAGNAGKVTFADLIYTLHQMKYGDAFTAEKAADYIELSDSGYFSKCFGIATYNISYLINEDLSMTGGAFTLALSDGDRVDLYKYLDETNFSDLYSYFTEEEKKVKAKQKFELQAEGLGWTFEKGPLKKAEGYDVCAAVVDENGDITPIEGAVMDENGKLAITFDKAGTYLVTAFGMAKGAYTTYDAEWNPTVVEDVPVPIVLPYSKITVEKADNTMTVKAKTLKVKLAKAKKKNQTFKAAKAFTVKKPQGKVTYKVTKKDKKAKNKIVIAKNGKVTVKKGIKKGTYKIKVKVAAAGDAAYKPFSKTVTLKVSVK